VEPADAAACGLVGVLRTLEQARSDGIVHVRAGDRRTTFFVSNGRIVAARADDVPPLGRTLLDRGSLSQVMLDAVLAVQRRKRRPQPLGEILVDLGIVTAAEAIEAVRESCIRAFAACARRGGTIDLELSSRQFRRIDPDLSVDLLQELALREAEAGSS